MALGAERKATYRYIDRILEKRILQDMNKLKTDEDFKKISFIEMTRYFAEFSVLDIEKLKKVKKVE